MKKSKKGWFSRNRWLIGFWMGVAVVSLINTALIFLGHDKLIYAYSLLGFSIIVLIVSLILEIKGKK